MTAATRTWFYSLAIAAPLFFCGCPRFETPTPPPPPATPLFPAQIQPGTTGVWRQTASGEFQRLEIHNPRFTDRLDPHPEITFQPGDRIAVRAGGCQATDHGKKLYVDEYGISSRLYRGMIWIPGATPTLARFRGLQDRWLFIPDDFPSGPLFLRMGYESDEYPGPSEDKACASEPQPWVQIYAFHPPAGDRVERPATAELDMKWNRWDPNLLPYYPFWKYKTSHADSCVGKTGNLSNCPDAQQLCNSLVLQNDRVSFGRKDSGSSNVVACTTQSPMIDRPVLSAGAGICGFGGLVSGLATSLHGHVNWFPATYHGTLQFDQRGPDGDVNIHLKPMNPGGPDNPVDSILTQENARNKSLNGAIELEFNDLETIYRFESPWWQQFLEFVEREGKADTQGNVLPDPIEGARAAVTGLAGVDNEHGAHAELHPVYALAIEEREGAKSKSQKWAFFARNWGNEGECSNAIHFLDLPDNTYTFLLPWDGTVGAHPTVNVIHGLGFGNHNNVEIVPSGSPAEGLRVSFRMPKKPEDGATLEGELSIDWDAVATVAPPPPPPPPLPRATVGVAATPAAAPAAAKPQKKFDSSEDFLSNLSSRLSDAEKTAYKQNIKDVSKTLPHDMTAAQWRDFKTKMDQERIRIMTRLLGSRVEKLDKKQIQAVCQALGGTVEGHPNLCK